MDKRGFIDDFIPMLFAAGTLVLLIVGVLVGSFLLKNEKTEATKEFSDEKTLNEELYNYLKTSIEFEGKKNTVAVFLSNTKDDDTNAKVELFRKHAENHFNKKFQGDEPTKKWRIAALKNSASRNVIATIVDGTANDYGYQAGHANCGYTNIEDSHASNIVLPSKTLETINVQLCMLDRDVLEIK